MTDIELKLLSNQTALNERAERLRSREAEGPYRQHTKGALAVAALKAQIRDLEIERHGLLQQLPID